MKVLEQRGLTLTDRPSSLHDSALEMMGEPPLLRDTVVSL
jgi:hypothetical protein